MSSYTNKAQRRLLQVIETLAGNELEGLPLNTLAKQIGTEPSTVYRDLKNLEEGGWAEQRENSSWRLTARAAAPLRKIQENLHSLMGKVNRINQEYLISTAGVD